MVKAEAINCHATQVYQVDARIPKTTTGELVTPALGEVTAIRLRISDTRNGSAIAGDVDNLSASERSEMPGRFWVSISKALHESRILPLGKGSSFFAIWSKSGEFDFYVEEFVVAEETVLT